MYLDFFKLKELPFRLTADPRFYYMGPEQAQAKSQLRIAMGGPGGFFLLTGAPGVGKTILLQDLLAETSDSSMVAQIRQPDIAIGEFYHAMLAQFGGAEQPASDSFARFAEIFAQQSGRGRKLVLVVDNAESLAEDLLEDLLELPDRIAKEGHGPCVVLATRPTIERSLRKLQFDLGAKPLGMRAKLGPFSEPETRRYMEHRLHVAGGGAAAFFRDDAFVEIQRFTGGIPRLINTLADAALMTAFNRSRDLITGTEIRAAVDQLQWMEFDARSDLNDATISGLLKDETIAGGDAGIGHLCIARDGAIIADFDLPVGKMTLGRATGNDVQIESQFISRHHCQIVTTAQYSVIEDLQSQNGLLVRSRRVSVHRLRHGDEVKIGEHTLTYSKSSRPAPHERRALSLVLGSAAPVPCDRICRN